MLLYFGSGRRDYHANPIPVFTRDRWSFQAVLKGEISLVESAGPGYLKSSHLWLCRPDFPHGWTGASRRPAEVAVFQFAQLPTDLLRRLPDDACLGIDLTVEHCRKIRSLAENVSSYWLRPLPGRLLYFERALIELSIIVLENLKENFHEEPFNLHQQRRVLRALQSFEERMEENPSLGKIGKEAGVSISQLRRDFIAVLHMSPKKAFDDIRHKRALEYLQQGSDSVERVSERCGFLSGSAFSRAFKNKFGRSPRKILPKRK
jgi:AraC family transcriptional regulator